MDPFTLVTNILGVAKSLLGLSDKLAAAERARRTDISNLFSSISDCLSAVASEVREGKIPHGKCGELITYADQLPGLLETDIGEEKATKLGRTLHSSYDVEGMAASLDSEADKEPYLKVIEEAAGKFRALSNLTRVG
jgi:hypothetical protein